MKYVLIDVFNGDMFNEEFSDLEAAINKADYCWNHLTNSEKKKRTAFYVLDSANPDEEAMDHLDGDIIKDYTNDMCELQR